MSAYSRIILETAKFCGTIKSMTNRKYNVIIPSDMKPRPKSHEESAAAILSRYFCSDVYFIKTANHETPDISIRGTEWEVKSPVGSSKNNIQKNMREAAHQSSNIVIDLRRSRLHQNRALGYIKQFLERSNNIRSVLVISKSGHVLAIK
jgi:hypothetical protein